MRWLVLLLALAAVPVAAQERGLANPVGLSRVVGYGWEGASEIVPPPDSGAIADGAGRLVWTDPGDGVDRVEVGVEFGTIQAVTIVDTRPETLADLERVAGVLASALGAPGADGFYPVGRIRALNPEAPYLDVAIEPRSGRLTYRKPSAPPPAAPPSGRNR